MQNYFVCSNKRETSSYIEIFETLGVDRPSNILFLTDVSQEATAAKAAGLCNSISVSSYLFMWLMLTELFSSLSYHCQQYIGEEAKSFSFWTDESSLFSSLQYRIQMTKHLIEANIKPSN